MCNIKMVLDKNVIAIIPEYVKDKGNFTKVVTKDLKEVYLKNRVNTILSKMAKDNMLDIDEIKKYVGDILGGSKVLPLVFGNRNIFVPIKVRKPLNSNDSCYGYFNLDYITIDEKKNLIILDNKLEINIVQNITSVKKCIKKAEIIKVGYGNVPFINVSDSNVYKLINKPATKLDIAIIRHEILNIKKECIKLEKEIKESKKEDKDIEDKEKK